MMIHQGMKIFWNDVLQWALHAKRLLDIWPRHANQFDTAENWSNSVTYSCSQIKLLKDNIKEFGTEPVISSVRSQDAKHKSQNPDFYRKLQRKALPFLR